MNFQDNITGTQQKPDAMAMIEAEFRQEFRERAGDMLGEAEESLEDVHAESITSAEALVRIRQIAHNLKGTGRSFGFPLVTIIAHRLENYVADLEAVDDSRARDIRVYFDYMRDVINGALDVREEEFAGIVRDLPAKPGIRGSGENQRGTEIMLVAPAAAATRIVCAEIIAGGNQVVVVSSTLDALEQVVQTKPDAVLVSAVMEQLSGVDLICALKAMPLTKGIPVALLTSLDEGDHRLGNLPKTVPVIHKGAEFPGELRKALRSLGIG